MPQQLLEILQALFVLFFLLQGENQETKQNTNKKLEKNYMFKSLGSGKNA